MGRFSCETALSARAIGYREGNLSTDFILRGGGVKQLGRVVGSAAKSVAGRIVSPNAEGNGTGKIIRNFSSGVEPNLKINVGQRNKHIVGTNEYKTANQVVKKSPLSDGVDPQMLVNEYAGTDLAANKVPLGAPGSVERIVTKRIIGTYYEDGNLIGPTSNFTIRYAKDGVHIIPVRPTK